MAVELEETTREQAARYLPALIERVLKSYHDFLMDEPVDVVVAAPQEKQETRTRDKQFTDYHNAGKVAIGHLDLLFKLAKGLGLDTGESERKMVILMEHAKGSANHFREQEVPKQDENDS